MSKKASRSTVATDAILRELRAFGLAYPGAHTKSPWPGHLDLAVKDKTFAYLSLEGEPLGISCKLPQSSEVALMLPFVKPTAYGLGKSGWVSASFDDREDIPVDMLKAWIDESYRAQAPKKLVATLGTLPAPAAPKRPARTPKPKAKATAARSRARRTARSRGSAAR
ncbi:MAG TPA: MmcQ/YjbR family DNA-binding protein [Kofleriaceae bacterium]|nr:MmcQ/YjbR family DNA-binding protein [Kofleriaceae bacterium]